MFHQVRTIASQINKVSLVIVKSVEICGNISTLVVVCVFFGIISVVVNLLCLDQDI